MNQLSISVITSADAAYREVFDLREEVLRKPLGLSLHNEDLSRDHTDVIMTGSIEGRVVCCLMLHHKDGHTVQMRQMAVYDQWQGRGLGRALVAAAEQHALQAGYELMILHARGHALGFYESMGYQVSGEPFTEVGIPHRHMEKWLKK